MTNFATHADFQKSKRPQNYFSKLGSVINRLRDCVPHEGTDGWMQINEVVGGIQLQNLWAETQSVKIDQLEPADRTDLYNLYKVYVDQLQKALDILDNLGIYYDVTEDDLHNYHWNQWDKIQDEPEIKPEPEPEPEPEIVISQRSQVTIDPEPELISEIQIPDSKTKKKATKKKATKKKTTKKKVAKKKAIKKTEEEETDE